MPEKVALQFSKLQHIGIPVNNVEKTIQFYQLLGFEVAMDRPFDHDEGAGRCVMMQRGGIVMEFYQLPGTVYDLHIHFIIHPIQQQLQHIGCWVGENKNFCCTIVLQLLNITVFNFTINAFYH